MAMHNQDTKQNKQVLFNEKQPYEPPRATCVQVQFEERVLGCNFSTIKNCGLTE